MASPIVLDVSCLMFPRLPLQLDYLIQPDRRNRNLPAVALAADFQRTAADSQLRFADWQAAAKNDLGARSTAANRGVGRPGCADARTLGPLRPRTGRREPRETPRSLSAAAQRGQHFGHAQGQLPRRNQHVGPRLEVLTIYRDLLAIALARRKFQIVEIKRRRHCPDRKSPRARFDGSRPRAWRPVAIRAFSRPAAQARPDRWKVSLPGRNRRRSSRGSIDPAGILPRA